MDYIPYAVTQAAILMHEVRMLAQWCKRNNTQTIFTPAFNGVITERAYSYIVNDPRGFRALIADTPAYPAVSLDPVFGA